MKLLRISFKGLNINFVCTPFTWFRILFPTVFLSDNIVLCKESLRKLRLAPIKFPTFWDLEVYDGELITDRWRTISLHLFLQDTLSCHRILLTKILLLQYFSKTAFLSNFHSWSRWFDHPAILRQNCSLFFLERYPPSYHKKTSLGILNKLGK